jgi:hypothetical protein
VKEQAALTKTLASKPEDHNERVVALQKTQRAQAKDNQKLLQEVAKVSGLYRRGRAVS